jgi:uncharacterized protein GlcG (DUF336 family)
MAQAREMNIGACVAVVDRAGNLLTYARMDNSQLLMGSMAQDKAYTVAAFGIPTHEWWDMIKGAPELANGLPKIDRLMVMGGGVAVTEDGQLVGAIGVSGGTADQDRIIAEAGAKAATL